MKKIFEKNKNSPFPLFSIILICGLLFFIFSVIIQSDSSFATSPTSWAESHLFGNIKNPERAFGPANNRWTSNSAGEGWESIFKMEKPKVKIDGTQTITILARKSESGGLNPTFSVSLYENGIFIREIISDAEIDTNYGKSFSGTFMASEVSDLENIEIMISADEMLGDIESRRSVQINSIEWKIGEMRYSLEINTVPEIAGITEDLNDNGPYFAFTEINIKATAFENYRFSHWSSDDGGVILDSNNPETIFTMPEKDVILYANFEKEELKVTKEEYRNLELYPESGIIFDLGTDENQKISIINNFLIGDGETSGTVTAQKHDTELEVFGNFTLSDKSTFIASSISEFLVAGSWNNYGDFIHNNGTVTFFNSQKESTILRTNFYNFYSSAPGKTFLFESNKNHIFEGSFQIAGSQENKIILKATTEGTRWLANFSEDQGDHFNPAITNAFIEDAGCSVGTGKVYLDSTSIKGDNVDESCWIWPYATVAGTVYDTDKNPYDCSVNNLQINVVTEDGFEVSGTCDSKNGNFMIDLGNIFNSYDTKIIVYIDKSDPFRANTLTTHTGEGDLTNLPLYENQIYLYADNSLEVYNSDFFALHKNNEGILYNVENNNFELTQGATFYISENIIYKPEGEFTTISSSNYLNGFGDLIIAENGELIAESNNLFIGGNYINNGTFNCLAGQKTEFTASSVGHSVNSGNSSFCNLKFNGTGSWSLNNDTSIKGNLEVLSGKLETEKDIEILGGSITGLGEINFVNGTTLLKGSGDFGGNNNWIFNSIIFDGNTSAVGFGDIIINNNLTILGTFDAGEKTYKLKSDGMPLIINGTFQAAESAIEYVGELVKIAPASYYSLKLNPETETVYTFGTGSGQTISVKHIDINVSELLANTYNPDLIFAELQIKEGTLFEFPSTSLKITDSFINEGIFNHNQGVVIFESLSNGYILDGGNSFYDIIFNGGDWNYSDGNPIAPNSTTVENGQVLFLNALTGETAINGGSLMVDWYLTIITSPEGKDNNFIETNSGSLKITENSTTPAPVVFIYSDNNWVASTQAITSTNHLGKTPAPEEDGSLRIREYKATSFAKTEYFYNIEIETQPGFFSYDYYLDFGENYLTASFSETDNDKSISDLWYREEKTIENSSSNLNNPPENGTWHIGLASDFSFEIDSYTVNIGELDDFNLWTNTGTSTITVSTSFSGGYTVRAFASNNGELVLNEYNKIERWPYENNTPATWDGNCTYDNQCGFGYSTSSIDLPGGAIDRFLGNKFAGFPNSFQSSVPVAGSHSAVPLGDQTTITYKVSAPWMSLPGIYQTSIFYIANVNY